MAHYAKIENGIVVEVIVADEDVIQTYEGTWLQTSYNANFRGKYAGIGDKWDGTNFVSQEA